MSDEMQQKNNEEPKEIAWANHHERLLAVWKSSIDFGVIALRLSSTTNGASAAILLAFISANSLKLIGQENLIGSSLFAFIIGMLVTPMAAGAAYLAQMFFTKGAECLKPVEEWPYLEETAKSKKMEKWGVAFQILSIVLVILSYIAFIFGAFYFYELVQYFMIKRI